MRNLAIAMTFFVLSSSGLNAALVPLSQKAREARAADIVEGYVQEISVEIVESRPGFSNYRYVATIQVHNIIKSETLSPGDLIQFSYWRVHQRPLGWGGNSGQYDSIEAGSTIRVYLTKNQEGGNSLLEPNGFDR